MKRPTPDSSQSASDIEPVPPEPTGSRPTGSRPTGSHPTESEPTATSPPVEECYRRGKLVVVENAATIPTDSCVKCGRSAKREVLTQLRSPSNPRTWFGKRPRIEVGLCRKHHENHLVAVALTWSVLGLGLLLFVAGVVTTSLVSSLVGLAAMAFSGLFRATSPVTSSDASEDYATIAGTGKAFRQQLNRVGDEQRQGEVAE